MNEELKASKDEPGTVQLGNGKQRQTPLYGKAGQQELRHLRSGKEQEGNNPTKEVVYSTSTLTFLCTQGVTHLRGKRLRRTSATNLLCVTLVTRRSTTLRTLCAPFSRSTSVR